MVEDLKIVFYDWFCYEHFVLVDCRLCGNNKMGNTGMTKGGVGITKERFRLRGNYGKSGDMHLLCKLVVRLRQ
jgi:hypothetical protein